MALCAPSPAYFFISTFHCIYMHIDLPNGQHMHEAGRAVLQGTVCKNKYGKQHP